MNIRRLLFLPTLVASAISTGTAQAQTEPRFGTRSPLECGAPVKSQPNEQEMKMLIRCKFEKKTNDHITLLEDIKVESGKTRAYSQFLDGYATSIDTDAKVLPIRGSLISYQCNVITKLPAHPSVYDVDNTGKNCMVVKQPHAEGKCYKTTFGDWWCGMQELVDPSLFVINQPPPPIR